MVLLFAPLWSLKNLLAQDIYIKSMSPKDHSIRPLAGIPEKKYGTIFLRDIAAMSQEEQVDLMENSIIGEYMNMMRFTPLSGTDVVVGADIPYMDYGKESVW